MSKVFSNDRITNCQLLAFGSVVVFLYPGGFFVTVFIFCLFCFQIRVFCFRAMVASFSSFKVFIFELRCVVCVKMLPFEVRILHFRLRVGMLRTSVFVYRVLFSRQSTLGSQHLWDHLSARQKRNRPFYSCVFSDLALDCKRGWG